MDTKSKKNKKQKRKAPAAQTEPEETSVKTAKTEQELTQKKETYEQAQKIVLGARPRAVQDAVDKAFEKNKKENGYSWAEKGKEAYGLLGLNDDLVFKKLFSKGKNEICIIDVGCGTGEWGSHAMRVLGQDEECQKTGKKVHIFSVTGGKECEREVERCGNITHCRLNQFKIENIDEEFEKRGFALKGQVDLIVSSWTLRHLVDPLGTLSRMYSLLSPSQGMLIADGFFVAFDSSNEVLSFPQECWNIFVANGVGQLFRKNEPKGDLGQFLLMRSDDQELAIPLEYTGEMRSINGYKLMCASCCVSAFKKGRVSTKESFCFKPLKYRKIKRSFWLRWAIFLGCKDDDDILYYLRSEEFEDGYVCYCHQNDQRSKELFAWLKRERLFGSRYYSRTFDFIR